MKLSDLVSEVEDDRESLVGIVRALGGDPDSVLHRAIRAGLEATGHASRVMHWLEGVSSLSELEKLRNGVAAKTVGWEVLLAAAAKDDRLSRVELERLIDRAHDQSDRLRTLQRHSPCSTEATTSSVSRLASAAASPSINGRTFSTTERPTVRPHQLCSPMWFWLCRWGVSRRLPLRHWDGPLAVSHHGRARRLQIIARPAGA